MLKRFMLESVRGNVIWKSAAASEACTIPLRQKKITRNKETVKEDCTWIFVECTRAKPIPATYEL